MANYRSRKKKHTLLREVLIQPSTNEIHRHRRPVLAVPTMEDPANEACLCPRHDKNDGRPYVGAHPGYVGPRRRFSKPITVPAFSQNISTSVQHRYRTGLLKYEMRTTMLSVRCEPRAMSAFSTKLEMLGPVPTRGAFRSLTRKRVVRS